MRAVRYVATIWLLLAAGCATHLYGETMPGTDLTAQRRVHVVRHAKDEQRIDQMIATRLERSGFDTSTGPEAAPVPAEAAAVISYEDHWMWDMSMYLLVLRIDFRDPATNELVASGQSYRSSGAREPAHLMVDEIITAILGEG